MDVIEAKKHIEWLKNKYRFTYSEKLKAYYLADIMSLENFIHSMDPNYECGISSQSVEYQKYRDRLLKEKERRVEEVLEANDENGILAKKYVSICDEVSFKEFIEADLSVKSEEEYMELFRDFMGSLGRDAYTKYNELIRNESILCMPIENYGGVCWDFPTLSKQVVVTDEDRGQYSYLAIAHEVGHAVHFHALNQVGRRTFEVNTFGESMSILFEKMYENYLEKNGFKVLGLKNFTLSQRLGEAASIDMCSSATKKGYAVFNGYDVVFDEFKLDDIGMFPSRYRHLYEKLHPGLEYCQSLYYLIGDATSRIFLDEYGDNPSKCIKKMKEFLIASELRTHKENIRSLEITDYDYPSLKLELIKNGSYPKK